MKKIVNGCVNELVNPKHGDSIHNSEIRLFGLEVNQTECFIFQVLMMAAFPSILF